MKYPCGIIKDLLPVFIENLCSEESVKAVVRHMEECEDCREYYKKMTADSSYDADRTEDSSQFEESLKKVKKTILYKKIIAVAVAITVFILTVGGIMMYLTKSFVIIPYHNNINVNQSVPSQYQSVQGQDYLSAEFIGTTVVWASQKRVDVEIDGKNESIIYFYGQTTRWENMISDDKTVTYHLLSPLNEDNDITKVYYYTGDSFDMLETLTGEQLKTINETAILLWSK